MGAEKSTIPNADDLAELDRQWAEIESGAVLTVPHEKVARWLETWGTADFKPWRDSASA
jgi:predicted transcriptional regulator